jgi:2-amino-4-hydroxy-6-hydroxymethyldihydropteridine diphosphokinase
MLAWIGLGGNLEDSAELLDTAVALLAQSPGVELRRQSRRYRTPPWGLPDQPDFVNAVAEFETSLEPAQLLQLLQDTESRLGRERSGPRWGPRCIDLDLLAYDDLRMQSASLTLPHPRMQLRAFVLVPLLELEPDFEIPGFGPAADCLQRIDPSERAAVVALPFQ